MEKRPQRRGARKTILLVDDDAEVLGFLSLALVRENHKVLAAAGVEQALRLSRDYKGEIDLLLAEFRLRRMSGVDLARKIIVERPQLEVLLTCGFTDGKLVLDEGWRFMEKPFSLSQIRLQVAGRIPPGSRVDLTEIAQIEKPVLGGKFDDRFIAPLLPNARPAYHSSGEDYRGHR